MRRVFLVLAALVVCVVVLGFFMGWFSAASSSSGGKSTVSLTVDQDQIQKDKEKAVDKVQDIGGTQPR